MRFQESWVDDFEGSLTVDNRSNFILNITLTNASGTIIGAVQGFNSSQAIQILVQPDRIDFETNGEPRNQNVQVINRLVRISGNLNCIPPDDHVKVSLYPAGNPEKSVTKMCRCFESGLEHYRRVDLRTKVLLAKIGGSSVLDSSSVRRKKSCQNCPEAWLRWIDPAIWSNPSDILLNHGVGDSAWEWWRIFVLVLMCLVSLCGCCLLIKCCMCLNTCCSCCD